MSTEIECTQKECAKREQQVKNMSFQDLEKYNKKCCECGGWIFKKEEVANKTYNAVSNKWAEEFNKKMIEAR